MTPAMILSKDIFVVNQNVNGNTFIFYYKIKDSIWVLYKNKEDNWERLIGEFPVIDLEKYPDLLETKGRIDKKMKNLFENY